MAQTGREGGRETYAGRASETEKPLHIPESLIGSRRGFVQERLRLQTESDIHLDESQRWFEPPKNKHGNERKMSDGNILNFLSAHYGPSSSSLWSLIIPLTTYSSPPRESIVMCVRACMRDVVLYLLKVGKSDIIEEQWN